LVSVYPNAPKVNIFQIQIQLSLNMLKWHVLRAMPFHSVILSCSHWQDQFMLETLLIGVRYMQNLSNTSKTGFKWLQPSEKLFHTAYLMQNFTAHLEI